MKTCRNLDGQLSASPAKAGGQGNLLSSSGSERLKSLHADHSLNGTSDAWLADDIVEVMRSLHDAMATHAYPTFSKDT